MTRGGWGGCAAVATFEWRPERSGAEELHGQKARERVLRPYSLPGGRSAGGHGGTHGAAHFLKSSEKLFSPAPSYLPLSDRPLPQALVVSLSRPPPLPLPQSPLNLVKS